MKQTGFLPHKPRFENSTFNGEYDMTLGKQQQVSNDYNFGLNGVQ